MNKKAVFNILSTAIAIVTITLALFFCFVQFNFYGVKNPIPTTITHPTYLPTIELLPTILPGSPTAPVLPSFPWPPPNPSAVANLTLGSIGSAASAGATLGDVNSRIIEALNAGGYDERSYYGVPEGFAIVTQLEQITPEGYPENSNRWVTNLNPVSLTEFSLSDYLIALFSMPKGYYRIFVFIVTSNLVFPSGTPVSQALAKTWVISGANKLPDSMTTIPFTKDYTCTVYVYEFIQSGIGEMANQNIPSNITGSQHLKRAGMWNILER